MIEFIRMHFAQEMTNVLEGAKDSLERRKAQEGMEESQDRQHVGQDPQAQGVIGQAASSDGAMDGQTRQYDGQGAAQQLSSEQQQQQLSALDIFEAQQALKLQPQVVQRVADLQTQLERSQRRNLEVNPDRCDPTH
jgi:hypothetical protein